MSTELLPLLVQASFWVGFSAMAGGVLYFSLERQSLAVEYQAIATLNAVVALVAAINYWTMKDFALSGDTLQVFGDFPTHFRYVDWLLTTPLLLAVIPILVGLGNKTKGYMTRLMIADVIMIGAGYIGETSINDNMAPTILGWVGFLVALTAFAIIVFTLYATLTSAERGVSRERAAALQKLKIFVSVGWLIYPLGFIMALIFDGATASALRELFYNIADILTKTGFGMIAVAAAKSASYTRIETA